MRNSVEIIAGRPSSGKTLLASQICRDSIINKKTIIYFSLELSKKYLTENFAIPKEVLILDESNYYWPDIKEIILSEKPNITIIDYLQLINNISPNLINQIIDDFNKHLICGKLFILSQISRKKISHKKNHAHMNMHKSILLNYHKNLHFTEIKKNTYKL